MPFVKRTLPLVVATLVIWAGMGGFGTGQSANSADVGQWAGPYDWPGLPIHISVLPTGKVLFWGGVAGAGETTYLWDPETHPQNGTFLTIPNATTDLFCSGHALLPDGQLLVTGGHIADAVGMKDTNIFDVMLGTWNKVNDMNAGRWYPTNTTLPSGEMLVLGGSIDRTAGMNKLPQVWQVGGGWRDLITALRSLPYYPWMHVASNGKAFYAGWGKSTRYLNTAGLGAWTTVGNSNFGTRDYGSSVLYQIDKVLIVGGGITPTATAEVIDLSQPQPLWRYVTPMAYARRHMNATLLPDGTVLVTGGTSGTGFNNASGKVFAAELWDPATETWATMASAQIPRLYHSVALLLPDGRVLSGGGGRQAAKGEVDRRNVELYSPPYLFKGPRPLITSAPTTVTYNQSFFVETPDAANVTAVTWIRLGSVTHAFNMHQRINALTFSSGASGLTVTAPASANLAPPGHYMLFLLMNGVPSVAKIIRIY